MMQQVPFTPYNISFLAYSALGQRRGRSLSVKWMFFAFSLLFLSGCQSGPDKNRLAVDAFVEEEVNKRLEIYRTVISQQCWDNILEEAGKIADSILINEARLKRDSVNKPPKPEKPEKPEMKHLKDSLTLDPLFRDTTN